MMIINGKETRTLNKAPSGALEIVRIVEGKDFTEHKALLRYVTHPNVTKVCSMWGMAKANDSLMKGSIEISRLPSFYKQLSNVVHSVVPEGLMGKSETGESDSYFATAKFTKIGDWLDGYDFENHFCKLAGAEKKKMKKAAITNYSRMTVENAMRSAVRTFGSDNNLTQRALGVTVVNITKSRKKNHVDVWVKARTSRQQSSLDILNFASNDPVRGVEKPLYLIPEMLREVARSGNAWYDSSGQYETYYEELSNKILFIPSDNKPGIVQMWLGVKHPLKSSRSQKDSSIKKRLGLKVQSQKTDVIKMVGEFTLRELATTELDLAGVETASAILDGVNMILAKPYDDDRLDINQQNVVGAHLSTVKGLVNAAETGDGKTVTTLTAFQEKASLNNGWLGLCITEANTREQWKREAQIWAPGIKVVTLESRKNLDSMKTALNETEGPVLLIMSYSLAADADRMPNEDPDVNKFTPLGSFLRGLHFDDMCVDEGLCLRNASRTRRALRYLRNKSKVGIVLTATPYNKSKNDFASLVMFARNDYKMFNGKDLDDEYDLTKPDDLDMWTKIMFPFVQRDSSIDSSQFPSSETEVIYLNPSIAELELATAIKNSLSDMLESLLGTIDNMAKVSKMSKAHAEMTEELRALKGRSLGSVTLARQSASDPDWVFESNSIAGELIRHSQIIEPNIRSTKRKKAISLVKLHRKQGEQIIVFTAFRSAALRLVEELRNEGVNVEPIVGGNIKKRDRIVEDFQNGKIDVVVATSAAKRGVNLHAASVLIHLDVDYVPEVVLQRNGRLIRRYSKHKTVKIYYLCLNGTIDAKVFGVAVHRIAESILSTDAVSGTELTASRTAISCQPLLDQVDTTWVDNSETDKMVRLVSNLVSA